MRVTALQRVSRRAHVATCAAVLCVVFAAISSAAHGVPNSDRVLRDLPSIKKLSAKQAKERIPVDVEAVVTYIDPVWGYLFVQSQGTGLFVQTVPLRQVELGDRIRIQATTNAPENLPMVDAITVEHLEHVGVPAATPVDLSQLTFGEHDSERVVARGEVVQAVIHERRTLFSLRSGQKIFYVTVARGLEFEEAEQWLGATIEVTGSLGYHFETAAEEAGEVVTFRAFQLFVNDTERLRSVTPRSVDLQQGRFLPNIASLPTEAGNYFIHGQVTYVDSEQVVVQAGSNALRLLTETATELQTGQFVRMSIESAFPHTWKTYVLRLAQPLATTQLPQPIDISSQVSPDIAYRRVRINGRLDAWQPTADGARMTFSNGDQRTNVLFRNPDESIAELHLGDASEISATGTLFPNGVSGATDDPYIVVGRLRDLQVVRRRAIFFLPTILAATSIAVGLCLGLLSWIRFLRRRVSEKTEYLSQVSAQLRSSYEAIRDGLVAIDSSGRILAINARARELLGLDLAPDSNVETLRQALARCAESRENFDRMWADATGPESPELRAFNWKVVHPKSRDLSVWSSAFADTGSEGEFGRLWIFHDVTQERTLETNIQQAQKLDAIGTLAGGIAHDFNNLLTVISGNLALAQSELTERPGADIAQELSAAESATHRASAVAGRLLTLAHSSDLELEPASVNEVISRLTDLLSRALGARYELQQQLDPELPVVNADTNLLEQVVLNLCVNARDAMPNGGPIKIRTYSEVEDGKSWVVIAVRDSGHGIPLAVRDRVFEPFFSTKAEGKGSGLGLAVSYGVARQHRGELDFDSWLGVGTEFRLRLPMCDEETQTTSPETPSARSEQAPAHVLVVDDEPPVRAVAERILKLNGYTVTPAAGGQQALDILGNAHASIDVILLDLTMPGLDGVEVFRRVRAQYPDIAVVLCSGYSSTEVVEGILPEPDGFVRKPYAVSDLVGAIEVGAGRSQRQRRKRRPQALEA